jgi:DNA gyrase/topoisomerase IV subunit B
MRRTFACTRITFEPDFTIFKPHVWDRALIRERMHELAAMNPKLTTIFESESFRCPEGLADLVGGQPVHLRSSRDGIDVEIALAWNDAGKPIFRGYVGQCRGDGTHVEGLRNGLRDAFCELDPRYKRATNRALEDVVMRGLRAFVHVMLHDPRFAAPTREWLVSAEAGAAVRATVVEGLRARWPHDPALRDRLLERV